MQGAGSAAAVMTTVTLSAAQRDYRAAAPVYAAQLHPNQSEIVAGDQEGRVCVWDVRGSSAAPVKEVQIEAEAAVRALAISPDGRRLAVASNRGRMVVYALAGKDTGQMAQVAAFQAHSTYILQCAYSPDSALLATASADHTVKLWRAHDDAYVLDKTLSGHQRWVWDCAFNSDASYIITGSSDHVARLWSVASGETIRHYAGHHKVNYYRSSFSLSLLFPLLRVIQHIFLTHGSVHAHTNKRLSAVLLSATLLEKNGGWVRPLGFDLVVCISSNSTQETKPKKTLRLPDADAVLAL